VARSAGEATTGYLLWRVTTKWRAAVDRAVAPLGLTHAQYTALASLYGLSRTGARPSQRELADFAGLEPIFVSKLVRALEQTGLLERAVHHSDPRAVQLRLTDQGTAVVRRAVAIVRELHEELTAPIGGTRGRRGQELSHTLRILLGIAPTNGSEGMSQPQTLTGQDIAEAQGAVRALLDRVLAGTGFTGNEYVAMRVLSVRGPFAPAELHQLLAGQRQLELTVDTAADLLGGLADRGVATGPDGPIELTPQGAEEYVQLSEAVAAVTRELYSGFDPADLATAHRVLAQVTERAGALLT
jgi:DNA-binding MarR family transcriptional regulator